MARIKLRKDKRPKTEKQLIEENRVRLFNKKGKEVSLADLEFKLRSEIHQINVYRQQDYPHLEPLSLEKYKEFQELKSMFVDGDKIYEYDDIGFLCGSAGYLLVRDNKVIHVYAKYRS